MLVYPFFVVVELARYNRIEIQHQNMVLGGIKLNPTDIEKLNTTFSLIGEDSQLSFKNGIGDIPLVEIKTKYATATISLQGAHILSWKPCSEDEVIWLSKDATFAMGKSVRGGVPICWPWFGAHENNTSFPAHGFARTVLWNVINTKILSTGEIQITFALKTEELEENIQSMWPQSTVVEYCITVGESLILELTTFNKSENDITVGQALHTYFNITDINKTTVYGLENKSYLDKVEGFCSKIQNGPITINSEVDRVYVDTSDDIIIDNDKRKILIEKQGSASTVVWNPWEEVANKMGDLGENGYQQMLCVESANAIDDLVVIKPGESATLFVKYEVK